MLCNNFIYDHLMFHNHFPNFNKLDSNMHQLQMSGLLLLLVILK